MSKLDDIYEDITSIARNYDNPIYIRENFASNADLALDHTKHQIKDLMIELIGEYSQYPSHYTISDVLYELRQKVNEL